MARAAKNETDAFGLLEHSMKRLTAPGSGSYDKRQARFDAATPACTPRDVMCAIENWKDGRHAHRIRGSVAAGDSEDHRHRAAPLHTVVYFG